MPKINDTLSILLGARRIQGKIVGIDHYCLENFEGKQHRWPSYTLVSDKKGLLKRFWITDWKRGGWILWLPCPKKKIIKNTKLVTDRSGIAKIEFSGDQGVSTPVAAISMHELKNGDYYALERFAGSEVMVFRGIKVVNPKVSKGL